MRQSIILITSLMLVLCGCTSSDDKGDDIFSEICQPDQPIFFIDISVLDDAGNDIIDQGLLWPIDVYAVYNGDRYNCVKAQNTSENNIDFGLYMGLQPYGLTHKSLSIGPFTLAKDYDGETIQLKWSDGSVDTVKFTVWRVYDSYSGTYTWANRFYINDNEVKGSITVNKDKLALDKKDFLDHYNTEHSTDADAAMPESALLWTIDGMPLNKYTIDVPKSGQTYKLECINYPALYQSGVDLGGCKWAHATVKDNVVTLTVDPFDGGIGESRSCHLYIGMYYITDQISIVQSM